MNNLNSIIIEGTVESVKKDWFVLVYTEQNKNEIINHKIPIQNNIKKIRKGNHVRIVGKLCESETSLYIKAEHLEVR